jgi:transcriptional regulator with PAS, ATPase and Fis domain
VLISGETGTGKELFAQAIHCGSPRRDGPFVALNCAAIPESLVESELFGYEDGAFTGARKGGKPGKFESADGGTIFLDEIGDMPLHVQIKLLRVLQERRVARVGSQREKPVDVRVVAATHKDLLAEVRKSNFRDDLYYRLNVLVIQIPPLRKHLEDVPALAEHLVRRTALRFNKGLVRLSGDFLGKLEQYSWPGNVRELENVIERAVIRVSADGVLDAGMIDFGGELVRLNEAPAAAVKPLRSLQKELILQALAANHRNILRTAIALGIGRSTLYRRMKKYAIEP